MFQEGLRDLRFLFFLLILVFTSSWIIASNETGWNLIKHNHEKPYFGDLSEEERQSLIVSIENSLCYLERKASKYQFPVNGITHEKTVRSLRRFREILQLKLHGKALDKKIKQEFDIYQSIGNQGKVLFTGYYAPVFQGSLKKNKLFQYPLYQTPKDLVKSREGKVLGRKTKTGKIVPYWTRREIEQENKLQGQGLELVYLKDPYEVYQVHLQGSAVIELEDKSLIQVGFAAKNKRDFYSLGRALIEEGKLSAQQRTPEGIKNYFKDHPDELEKYYYKNDSYVFFRKKDAGPYGSLAIPLTKEHSIALDKTLYPKACLCFVSTYVLDIDSGKKKKYRSFKHFAFNHDSGGAIKGPSRCDIFFGIGKYAGKQASSVYSFGQLYFLFLKD